MYNTIIATRSIGKEYGSQKALSDINISIKPGEIYGLVGNNGAGKTTLLRIITGQAFATEGDLSLFDKTSQVDIVKTRRRIGSLIETPGFFLNMTAKQNLEYFRLQFGIPGKERVEEVLQTVGLSGVGRKNVGGFSLGMKQRLGIGLALLGNPELLILDEPINGLDPTGIIEIRNLLLKLNKEKNITILISSHILTELANVVTQYGFLNRGVMLEQISAENLAKKCESYLEIKVSNVEKFTAALETDLSMVNYKIYPDQTVHIYESLDKPERVSMLAARHGIPIMSLNVKSVDIENYYMTLLGGC
ncbi:MAG TPA: ATP-binding cassette domain-containing protein [Lachnospiraceae bacterium]|nr:ATP-binding cassette domain-containing protein [Lachnospiraceae bacterium]